MSVEEILRAQHGVITRRQAAAAGLPAALIDDRVRRRRWRPLLPQVYLATGRPPDPEARARAALLWAGRGAALAGASAAWWYGLLPEPPARLTVVVDRAPPPERAGLVVRRAALPAVDLDEHRGLRVTARPLTVLQAAVELHPVGADLLDRALRGWLPHAELAGAHRRNPSIGGQRVLAAAARRSTAAGRQRLVGLLRQARVTGWRPADPSDTAAVTFPAAGVAVEVIGWAPASGERRSTPPGRTVVTVRWSDLAARPRQVLHAVRDVLDRSRTA